MKFSLKNIFKKQQAPVYSREQAIADAKDAVRQGQPESFADIIRNMPSHNYATIDGTVIDHTIRTKQQELTVHLQDLTASEIRSVLSLFPADEKQKMLDNTLIYALNHYRSEHLAFFDTLLHAGADANARNGAPLRICAMYDLLESPQANGLIKAGASVALAFQQSDQSVDLKTDQELWYEMCAYDRDESVIDTIDANNKKSAAKVRGALGRFKNRA